MGGTEGNEGNEEVLQWPAWSRRQRASLPSFSSVQDLTRCRRDGAHVS